MATYKAVSSNPTRNNRGTVVAGGSSASENLVAPTTLAQDHNSDNGPVFGNPETVKAINSRSFANLSNDQFIIRRVTTEIAGVADTTLQTGASEFGDGRQGIHPSVGQRSLLQVTAGWNYVTGAFLSTPSVTNETWHTIGSPPPDDEAHPTRSRPGEFTYRDGGPSPVNDDYDALTG